jgi:hypothetical protein
LQQLKSVQRIKREFGRSGLPRRGVSLMQWASKKCHHLDRSAVVVALQDMRGEIMRRALLAIASCSFVYSAAATAGSYAELAAQVQADGGLLRVWATGALQSKTTAALDSIALGICHTVAGEGIQVTRLQFLAPNGRILYTVSASQLLRC